MNWKPSKSNFSFFLCQSYLKMLKKKNESESSTLKSSSQQKHSCKSEIWSAIIDASRQSWSDPNLLQMWGMQLLWVGDSTAHLNLLVT